MATIIPRWEWRTFGPRFKSAEAVFNAMAPKDVQESDEIYLLTETGSNVKIRSALLDIKVLKEVNPAGLEQWIPVLKAGFPLPSATVEEAFKAMDVPAPELKRAEYSLEQFLNEVVAAVWFGHGCQRAQEASTLHGRRLYVGILRCIRRGEIDQNDRSRIGR